MYECVLFAKCTCYRSINVRVYLLISDVDTFSIQSFLSSSEAELKQFFLVKGTCIQKKIQFL